MPEIQIDDSLVKKEFTKSTEQFHVIKQLGLVLLLNIIWCISDYLFCLKSFYHFLFSEYRITDYNACPCFKKDDGLQHLYHHVYFGFRHFNTKCIYVERYGFSQLINNAFAYMVLFIGVGMLVLWEIWYSIIIVVVTIVCNVVFYLLNSKLKC